MLGSDSTVMGMILGCPTIANLDKTFGNHRVDILIGDMCENLYCNFIDIFDHQMTILNHPNK